MLKIRLTEKAEKDLDGITMIPIFDSANISINYVKAYR